MCIRDSVGAVYLAARVRQDDSVQLGFIVQQYAAANLGACRVGVGLLVAGVDVIGVACIPVSYTHLDVYKRQVIYRTVIACALTFSFLKATDLKIITAVIVAFALALPVLQQKSAERKLRRENAKKYDALITQALGGETHA